MSTTRPAIVLAGSLALCAGCAGAGPALTPTVQRGEKLAVMHQLVAALERGNHKCTIDGDGDALCDADRKDSPTVVISLHAGPAGVQLTFLAAFPWKTPDPCVRVVPAVNQFNALSTSYFAVCTAQALVFETIIVVPENGLTDHDVHAFMNWWEPTSVQLALASPMASELK